MTEYQITVGYKAIVVLTVKADTENEAREKGVKEMKKFEDRAYKGKCELTDSNYKVDGILNVDETWSMLEY